MRLAGKVAIISGAASGMGTATARMFAREGAKVVIADVLEHEGRQVAQAIGAAALFEPLDVTKEDDWAAVVAATTKHFGKHPNSRSSTSLSASSEKRSRRQQVAITTSRRCGAAAMSFATWRRRGLPVLRLSMKISLSAFGPFSPGPARCAKSECSAGCASC